LYLECIFDELSTEVKVLFDRRDPASVLWPRRQALTELLEVVNAPELAGVWREDETIGWVYQYFNSAEERRAMREASQAPQNSRELAVRNQFFTPRYVVQFLTDNTLGRIWYEMRRGETTLKERCEYLVRRPIEVFLGEPPQGEEAKRVGEALAAVYDGDFSKLPEEVRWGETAVLAHVINGYDLAPALGLGDCAELANRKAEEYAQTGVWTGNAAELWCCLFFEHRRYWDSGREPEGEAVEGLLALYRTLRARLTEEPASQEDALRRPVFVRHRARKDPRDLKVLDPACGSGHFLLYAFDLLLAIYEEGWADEKAPALEATGRTLRDDYPEISELRREAPILILKHNLHGIDIDPRCAQIAALALWMRAQRAFQEARIGRADRPRVTRTNVVLAEPMPGERDLVEEFAASTAASPSPTASRSGSGWRTSTTSGGRDGPSTGPSRTSSTTTTRRRSDPRSWPCAPSGSSASRTRVAATLPGGRSWRAACTTMPRSRSPCGPPASWTRRPPMRRSPGPTAWSLRRPFLGRRLRARPNAARQPMHASRSSPWHSSRWRRPSAATWSRTPRGWRAGTRSTRARSTIGLRWRSTSGRRRS
jgi:hypothetical protein